MKSLVQKPINIYLKNAIYSAICGAFVACGWNILLSKNISDDIDQPHLDKENISEDKIFDISGIFKAVFDDCVAALPSLLLLPKSIEHTFVNVYSVENPAIITHFFALSQVLLPLYLQFYGKSLYILSFYGIFARRIESLASFIMGVVLYKYSQHSFNNSILLGSLNVFHGSHDVIEMADHEIRLYKILIQNLAIKLKATPEVFADGNITDELTRKIVSSCQKLIQEKFPALSKKNLEMFSLSMTRLPLETFVKHELHIKKISKEEGRSFLKEIKGIPTPSSVIPASWRLKANVDVDSSKPVGKTSKILVIGEKKQEQLLDSFMDKYQVSIKESLEDRNILGKYAIHCTVCFLCGITSFRIVNSIFEEWDKSTITAEKSVKKEEALTKPKRNKQILKFLLSLLKRLYKDHFGLLLSLIGCGFLSLQQ